MRNFLIGMPGGFDYKKFNRDFQKDFFGIEACMFNSDEDINTLIEESKKNKFNIGIHFPLHKGIYKPCRDPLLLSMDTKLKEEAYEAFEEEVSFANKIGAEYILIHFPKPVLVDTRLDWSFWRFANAMEWIDERLYPFDIFKSNFEEMFERLSYLSEKYEMRIVLEHDAVNSYIYNTQLLENLLDKYPRLKICVDTGRLHMFEHVEPNFNSKKFALKMAPYTYLIHLWNDRVKGNTPGGHYPVLPNLKTCDGWGDTEGYLRIITSINKDVKVLFEHRSDLISDDELETCYRWIESFFIA